MGQDASLLRARGRFLKTVKRQKPEPQKLTLFNLNDYTDPIHFYDLDNEGCIEGVPPTGKNRAYTAGMKVGQVIELLENRKRGLVVAIVDGRYVRVWFPGESEIQKVCADDFEVNHLVRVHLEAQTQEKRTLTNYPQGNESVRVHCTLTDEERRLDESVRVHLEAQTQQKRTLTQLAGEISQLPLSDLHELKAIIDGLIQAMEPEAANEAANSLRGHFEFKRVKGYGPYRYLRYWSQGKHRSVYLGKK